MLPWSSVKFAEVSAWVAALKQFDGLLEKETSNSLIMKAFFISKIISFEAVFQGVPSEP
jgi:hypothetical protein